MSSKRHKSPGYIRVSRIGVATVHGNVLSSATKLPGLSAQHFEIEINLDVMNKELSLAIPRVFQHAINTIRDAKGLQG